MRSLNEYDKYEDYVNFQLKKTSDKSKQKKWLGDEWQKKINIFENLFKNNLDVIKDKTDALCLGSRTGQEVVALNNIGVKNVIWIDLHEFKPYTIKGDIHNLEFENESFDLEFTNILDHSLYPYKFAKEIYRTLKKDGIFILHVQYGIHQDIYTETVINSLNEIEVLFKDFKLLRKKSIDSDIIAMNYEFIFIKQ